MTPFLKIRSQKDFASGLLYVAVGSAFAIGATEYKLGTPERMGPGYFPFWLGVLLGITGLIVLAGSLRAAGERTTLPKLDLRTLAWILSAVVLFGLMLQPLGLVVSLVALVVVSSAASHEFSWKGALLNALLLLSICLGAFIYGLGLQLPVWPAFIA